MSTGLVVCFSGRIGSGKSSVTAALSKALDWPKVGFGDYLRDLVARQGGDPTSRQALQDLGQSLVEADANAFCAAVLASSGFVPGQNLLVDGIRHADIHARVAKLALPSAAPLIHLAIDDIVVRERVATRFLGSSDLARAESHRVEGDLRDSLPSVADCVVDARQSLAQVIDDCLFAIGTFGADCDLIKNARSAIRSSQGS